MTHAELTTCADYCALLRGVLEHPRDDLRRLVLADFLEENGDAGGRGRAEFVRVQCESESCCREALAPGGDTRESWRHIAALWQRRNEFLAIYEGAWSVPWRPKAVVRAARRRNGCCDRFADVLACPCLEDAPEFTWSRGFVVEVALTQAAFAGGPCPADGCRGGHLVGAWQDGRPCCACSGTGRTPGLAAALFAAHPITNVVLTDRHSYWNGGGYVWYAADRDRPSETAPDSANLPARLFDRMKTSSERLACFPTFAAANEKLSRAAVDHGRELAGLPPLAR